MIEIEADYIFCGEMITASRLSFASLHRLHQLLTSGRTDPGMVYEVIESVNSYLHSITRISLALWPSSNGLNSKKPDEQKHARARLNRGKLLRERLEITEDDREIIGDRKFRNHLAHIDERLDDWIASGNKSYLSNVLGPRSSISGVDDACIFELFDPTTLKYYFRGDVFDLVLTSTCVKKIYDRATKFEFEWICAKATSAK
jgi:hypothetical protein